MEKKSIKIITQTIEKLLKLMGFKAKVEAKTKNDYEQENLICDIEVDNYSDILIGQYETNLNALQHIARLAVRKKMEDKIKFTLDINSYRQKKNEIILKQAVSAAEKVIKEKKSITLNPMTPYERRLVHIKLKENEAVITESMGEDKDRKIIIKPA